MAADLNKAGTRYQDKGPKDAGADQVTSQVQAAQEKGYFGTRQDKRPLESYSLAAQKDLQEEDLQAGEPGSTPPQDPNARSTAESGGGGGGGSN